MIDRADLRLALAARRGNLAKVERFLAAGADASVAIGERGDTALHHAARAGHAAVVGHLLAAGVPVDAGNAAGASPLILAVENDHLAVARQLLQAGADTGVRDIWAFNGLHIIARSGEPEVARLLLEHGVDPNAIDCNGETPLHTLIAEAAEMAVWSKRYEFLDILIAAKADLQLRNADGLTAVQLAIKLGWRRAAFRLWAAEAQGISEGWLSAGEG